MAARLDSLKTRLDQYMLCEETILGGAQEYYIGTRRIIRADLKEVSDMILYLEREIAREERKVAGKGRIGTYGIIPRDF